MNLKYFLIFVLLIASAIAYRKHDEERQGRRWQHRNRDNTLADLETKLADDEVNAEPLPEDVNDNSNWRRLQHIGWRRKGCMNKNEGQVDAENEQNDVKCERRRFRGWYRRENQDNNEKDRNENNHENHRPRGWYRRTNKPGSDDAVKDQNQNEQPNSGRHHYRLRKHGYNNQSEQSSDLLNIQNENQVNKEEVKPENHHNRSWFHRRNPNGQEHSSKSQKNQNTLRAEMDSDLRHGKHHHHHHRHHHHHHNKSSTTTSAPASLDA